MARPLSFLVFLTPCREGERQQPWLQLVAFKSSGLKSLLTYSDQGLPGCFCGSCTLTFIFLFVIRSTKDHSTLLQRWAVAVFKLRDIFLTGLGRLPFQTIWHGLQPFDIIVSQGVTTSFFETFRSFQFYMSPWSFRSVILYERVTTKARFNPFFLSVVHCWSFQEVQFIKTIGYNISRRQWIQKSLIKFCPCPLFQQEISEWIDILGLRSILRNVLSLFNMAIKILTALVCC